MLAKPPGQNEEESFVGLFSDEQDSSMITVHALTKLFLGLEGIRKHFVHNPDDLVTSLQNFRGMSEEGKNEVWNMIFHEEEPIKYYVDTLAQLLAQDPVRNAFPPAYFEISSAGSQEALDKEAMDAMEGLEPGLKPWLWDYAKRVDPKHPHQAMSSLDKRWHKQFGADGTWKHRNVGGSDTEGESKTSSITGEHPSPKTRKHSDTESDHGCGSNVDSKLLGNTEGTNRNEG